MAKWLRLMMPVTLEISHDSMFKSGSEQENFVPRPFSQILISSESLNMVALIAERDLLTRLSHENW
jgi:hypothetical protein